MSPAMTKALTTRKAAEHARNDASESRTLLGKWLVAASHKTGRREVGHVAPPDFSSDLVCLAQI